MTIPLPVIDPEIASFSAQIESFEEVGGWHYVKVPLHLTNHIPSSGRIWPRIEVTIGQTNWCTSLLPLKNKIKFIAIKKEIRLRENLKKGDRVNLQFRLI